MWFRTVGGQQFMTSTLPHILRTVEQLSNNLGRLAMAAERKEKIGIGGDLEYLNKLVFEYGTDATVGQVAVQEMARVKKEAAESAETVISSVAQKCKDIENAINQE